MNNQTLKYSRQRESILDYLKSTSEHPTADTVYSELKNFYPNLSLGTVYRNLNLLVERGEIIKLTQGESSDRFDGNPHPHYHFICTNCGAVIDLEMDSIDHINIIANTKFPGKIKGHNAYFYGTCENCSK